MSIKIIATDLDGTLMGEDHVTVSNFTKETLYAAHKKGIKIGIATGRTFDLTKSVVNQVPFCDFMICSNGATVVDLQTKKPIYDNLIPYNIANEIMGILDEYSVFYELYFKGHSVCQSDKVDYFDKSFLPNDFLEQIISIMEIVDDVRIKLNNRPIEKINVFATDIKEKEEIEKRLEKIDCLSVTSAIADDIEICLKSANKGDALEGICKIYGFSSDEAMAFGDAGNDIPMLNFAKYSFAMENGTHDCKNSAKFIAESNKNDGLAKAIEKYALKRE